MLRMAAQTIMAHETQIFQCPDAPCGAGKCSCYVHNTFSHAQSAIGRPGLSELCLHWNLYFGDSGQIHCIQAMCIHVQWVS